MGTQDGTPRRILRYKALQKRYKRKLHEEVSQRKCPLFIELEQRASETAETTGFEPADGFDPVT